MEQQKILWIILSVAVLLLAVLGTVLFIFTPASASDAPGSLASARVISTNSFDPVEWARSREDYPGVVDRITDESEGEFVVVYGESTGQPEKKQEVKSEESVVVIAVPALKAAESAAPVRPAVVKTSPAPVEKKSAPAPAVRQVTEYWIQAGSFTSLNRAETAKTTLVSKGLGAAIQTRTVDSRIFYRVRIGPYSSKEEADKFLFWIKDIDGFIQSYVSQVQAMR